MKKFTLTFILLLPVLAYAQPSDKFLPTSLKITVVDELGNPIEGASVAIYASKEDYLNSSKPVQKIDTNGKGVVRFKKLEPIAYYIEVVKGNMKNDGLEAVTGALQEGKINKATMVII